MKDTLTTRTRRRLVTAAVVGGLAATLGLAGCGGDEVASAGIPGPAPSAAALTVEDPWV